MSRRVSLAARDNDVKFVDRAIGVVETLFALAQVAVVRKRASSSKRG